MAVIISVIGKADMKAIEKAQKELDGLKANAVTNAGGFKGAMSGIGSAVTGTAAKMASGLAAVGIASWLKGAGDAAKNTQASQAALANTVNSSGASWDALSGKINSTIASASSMSGYSKGDLRGGLQTLITTTGDATASQDLLGVTMDLARRKGIDLSSAATLVGKAYNGNTTALQKMGIELPKGASGMAAIDALQKRVAGSAKTYGDSAAGAQDKFKNALAGLQTQVGTKLLPVITSFTVSLTKIVTGFTSLPGPVQSVALGLLGVLAAGLLIVPWIAKISTVIGIVKEWELATKLQSAAQWLLNAAMSANPIGLVVIAIVALIAIFVLLWTKCEGFRNFFIAAWNDIKAAWNAAPGVFSEIGTRIGSAFQSVVDWFKSIPSKIMSALGNLASLLRDAGTSIMQGLFNGLLDKWSKVKEWVSGIGQWIKDHKGPISVDAKLLTPEGGAIMDSLKAGFQQKWPGVTSLLDSYTAQLGNMTLAPSYAGSSGGRSVTIAPGAIVINLPAGSNAETANAAGEGVLAALAREIGRN